MTARILVVDDEPDLEGLLVQKFRHQIREGKVEFLFARDGVEALATLEANHDVDMVVTDINMPRIDGLSLLQKLQEHEEKLSTIIVSAYGDMTNIRTAMNCGAFDFLIKPIDFADLEATIAKTIRHVEFLREIRRRQVEAERAYASLSRYFSPNLAQRLAGDLGAIDLGGQRREITTLFTDIAGFTTLVELIEPGVLGPLLCDYLTGMTDIVFAHEGTVAKIIGDALHVLFGAPSEQPDHATRAVSCALALDEYAQSCRQHWRQKGVALGATRIGAHAGSAIVGNFGSGRFFEYTAHGDQHGSAAGGRQQAFRNPHLRQRDARGASAEFSGSSDRRPCAEGQDRGHAVIRAASSRAIRWSGHRQLFEGFCAARGRRPKGDRGFCRACRSVGRRSVWLVSTSSNS